MSSISNHPQAKNLKNTVQNGPVAQNVKAEAAKTKDEFADLANARTTPEQPAATGQPLTHYHSMFYRLLSWKNPRATSISFAASVAFIFAARYLNVIRYIFKGLWMVLGVTAAAEGVGKVALGKGLVSQIRPNKYFVIPKASLERLLDDVEQFINFFVIEFQRVVFAENLPVTVACFFAALISYGLIKFVPLWGLSLIATTVLYLGPLVYIKNKDLIDAQLEQATHVVNQQAHQIRDLAQQQTAQVTKTVQTYAGEYTHLAQDKINQYRGRSASPEAKKAPTSPVAGKKSKGPEFPAVPKDEPVAPAVPSIEKIPEPAI